MKRKSSYLIAPLVALCLVLTAEVVDRVVAVVGDQVITQRELDRAYNTDALALMRPNPITGAEAEKLTREQYLDRIIERKVIDQEIKRQGIQVEDMEVERAVTRKRESLGVTEADFARALAMQGVTMEDYRSMVREQLTTYRLISQEVRGEIEVTEEEIQAYYNQHPEQFVARDQYHLRLIFLRFSTFSEQEGQTEVITNLENLRAQIVAGADFAEMAKTNSQANSAINGGDIGWFELSEMLDTFAEQAKSLAPGQMSPVFYDHTGAYLLYCEEIKQGSLRPLTEVHDVIFEVIYQQEAMERYSIWLERLKASAYIENRLTNETTTSPKP